MAKTPADLVRDHRDDYLRRKLARSPLLNFMPGPFRVDICSLFEGVRPNLPAQDKVGVSTPSALVAALVGSRGKATILGMKSALIQKLLKIKKDADEVRHSTGQHSLYLAYPCVILPGEAGKTKFAPVFLFALDIQANAQLVTITRRGNDQGGADASSMDDALFNRLLAAFVRHDSGVTLGGGDDARMRIDLTTIEQIVDEIFEPWPQVSMDWQFPSITPVLSKEALKALLRGSSDPIVVDHAVIGLADFSGQSLLDDLDKIEQALRDGESCVGPLKKLLEAGQTRNEATVQKPMNDDSKWLIEKSDPSQEAVIWAQRTSPLVVLQGPPGTGKSQTIVNTIADAVASKQNVLVVCQKRAATEVVKKRLDAVGIGALATLVDDIDQDRTGIINRIREVAEEFPNLPRDATKRGQLGRDIEHIEAKIDGGAAALADDGAGERLRFSDIQASLAKLGMMDRNAVWSKKLLSIVQQRVAAGLGKEQLKAQVEHHREIDASAAANRYPENRWSTIDPKLASDPVSQNEIGQQLRIALRVGAEIEAGRVRLQHDCQSHWVAEHPWFSDAAALPHWKNANADAQEHADQFSSWLSALRHLNVWNSTIDPNGDCDAARSATYSIDALKELELDYAVLADIANLRAKISSDDLLREADRSLLTHIKEWAPQLQGAVLQEWRRALLDARRVDFQHSREIETLCEKLSKDLIAKRIADATDILSRHGGRVDARDTLSEAKLLRLRGSPGTPKTSLRRLHHLGSDEVKRLQPILLTSPENASSMLPLKPGHYDLVVIDEASQMFVAEAIPMLYRAKRALIAGDKEQMPPSNTFAFSDDGQASDADEGVNDELAPAPPLGPADRVYRLLDAADEALGENSPSKRTLEIHYRSARKELIDFSNHAFYGGKLVIPSGNAPLPAFLSSAIEYEQLTGDFNKGINELEAHRIVERIVEIFELPDNTRPTLGVIVNNIKQKARVEELLAAHTERNAELAKTYAAERERILDREDVSFFVRSVENVQGDERDVIIFGATYSGDKRNFGPLTASADGRKRLNVAVTRAKRGMIVVCSLNLAHTSNEAERDTHDRYFFWQYLRYARAIAANDREMVETILNQLNEDRAQVKGAASTDSPFEDEVKQFIESAGFDVTPQVGESGFRIDLGVRVSGNDLNYLCGVECDGAPFHSSWSARTRDVWRQEILESKGWTILRVWSTRWYDNPGPTKESLLAKLKELRGTHRPSPLKRSPVPFQDSELATPPTTGRLIVAGKPSSPGGPRLVATPSTLEIPKTKPPPVRSVSIGDTVEYIGTDKIVRVVRIVRAASDPPSGTVNFSTPLAQALLDEPEGSDIIFESPMGPVQFTIHRISTA